MSIFPLQPRTLSEVDASPEGQGQLVKLMHAKGASISTIASTLNMDQQKVAEIMDGLPHSRCRECQRRFRHGPKPEHGFRDDCGMCGLRYWHMGAPVYGIDPAIGQCPLAQSLLDRF